MRFNAQAARAAMPGLAEVDQLGLVARRSREAADAVKERAAEDDEEVRALREQLVAKVRVRDDSRAEAEALGTEATRAEKAHEERGMATLATLNKTDDPEQPYILARAYGWEHITSREKKTWRRMNDYDLLHIQETDTSAHLSLRTELMDPAASTQVLLVDIANIRRLEEKDYALKFEDEWRRKYFSIRPKNLEHLGWLKNRLVELGAVLDDDDAENIDPNEG